MRPWPTLLLGSAILLMVTAYLHFFNPDLKQDLKQSRNISYKSFKTLKTDELVVRGQAKQKFSAPKDLKGHSKTQSIAAKIERVKKEFTVSCLKGSEFFDQNPDYIDPNSKNYQNPYKARDILNNYLSVLFNSLSIIYDSRDEIESRLVEVESTVSLDAYQNHIREYEELVRSCGLSDIAGPVLMSFAEVANKRKLPELNYLMVEMYVNAARELFLLKTFTGYEIGLGALRNMNSFVVLTTQESEDLLNLSERVERTYENYRREVGENAESLAEVEEAFLYYQIEREVLYELLNEFLENLSRSYLPDYSRIDSSFGE